MFLFRITKNSKSSYLLGTCHNFPFFLIPKVIRDFILSQETLVTESYSPAPLEQRLEVMRNMGFFQKDNSKLEELELKFNNENNILYNYKDKVYALVNSYIEENNFPFKFCDLSLEGIMMLGMSSAQAKGMDSSIQKAFKNSNKSIFTLEEPSTAAPNIFSTLEHLENAWIDYLTAEVFEEEQIDSTTFSYNLPFDIINYFYGVIPPAFLPSNHYLRDSLYTTRNLNWLPKILELHTSYDDIIFSVGLGHLLEEQGLIHLLFESNFSIERMNYNGEFQEFTLEEWQVVEKVGDVDVNYESLSDYI